MQTWRTAFFATDHLQSAFPVYNKVYTPSNHNRTTQDFLPAEDFASYTNLQDILWKFEAGIPDVVKKTQSDFKQRRNKHDVLIRYEVI
jgi:hypothetical protein